MKIAIDKLETSAEIVDLDNPTAGAIVGGETGVSVDAQVFASGDLTFTQTDAGVYSFTYKAEEGTYSVSFGFALGLGVSFEAA